MTDHQYVTHVSTAPAGLWSTKDPDEAAHVLADVYAPHQLTVRGSGRFRFSFEAIHTKDLTVGYNRFDSDVHIVVPPPSTFYTLCYAPDGPVRTSSGDRTMVASPSTVTLLHPDFTWTFSDWSRGTSMVCVRLDRVALEEELSTLLDAPLPRSIDFGGMIDLRHGIGQDFARVLQTLRSASGRLSGLAELHPLVADRTGQLLRSALLLGCEHNYTEALSSGQLRSQMPAAVRRVLDAIDADPMAVCSSAEAARLAHVGVRALDKAFQRYVGASPLRYARRVRLARAREDLISADPERDTVIGIAQRWGFGHAGRFAALYEQTYGEAPSCTLRR